MNVLLVVTVYLNVIANAVYCYIIEPGPQVAATKGEVWPKPQHQVFFHKYLILRPQAFEFIVPNDKNCDLLLNAIERYHNIISKTANLTFTTNFNKTWKTDTNFLGYLDNLTITLENPCADIHFPDESMKEQYSLNIVEANKVHTLSANSVWGILRGLETFSQLLYPTNGALQINITTIIDYPRFSHRGLLIDTSRHYIPLQTIFKNLDAMAYNKMNVFHWHITDDQSFPYESSTYPELSLKGAYSCDKTYSSMEVQKVLRYAAARGIRVMVEFDTPGHTRSWGVAVPQLLTPCYDNERPTGQYGPIDPTKNFTYTFLTNFFQEIVAVFPEHYLHLGGDETEYECWESNPDIIKFMKNKNFTTYNRLEEYYIQKLINIIDDLKSKSIVWEEVFTNGVILPKYTVVHVWKSDWVSTITKVLNAGYSALLSSCWYLDHLSNGGDWIKYYDCEPYSSLPPESNKDLILGGEACMWTEVVNQYNIESRIWPRASATAEKLWSAENADTSENAARRLEEHACRMNRRDINAQPPNGPGYCA